MLIRKWSFFLLLCIIWGSSFILMKLGLYDSTGLPALTPVQVAAIRIFSASLALLPFAISSLRRISRKMLGYITLAGLLGSFFPAFLFCIAETRIDSALTAMINSATPLFAILFSAIIFKNAIPQKQVWGVILGFSGCISLFYSNRSEPLQHFIYAGFVVVATMCYGLNVNIVKQKLHQIKARDLTAISFLVLLIPSGVILWMSGYFNLPLTSSVYLKASIASLVLGVVGTAFATIIFYVLVKIASPLFASLVTYGIPIVAIGWGILYGESIGPGQLISLLVILIAVYISSRR